jgi:serine/threonine protein kinase
VSPHSVRLEREFYVTKRLYSLPGGEKYVPNVVEYVSLVQDGLAALLYTDVNPSDYIYFEQDSSMNYFTLSSLSQLTHDFDIWKDYPHDPLPNCNEITLDVFLTFAIECCSALQFLHENGVVHGELRPSAFQCRYNAKDETLSAKVWNFGGGLNSYEELLLTSSRWRSWMSTSEGSGNSNGSNNLIPTPPPPPPLPQSHLEEQQRSTYFLNPPTPVTAATNIKKPNSSRFYSPKEFQTSLVYVSPEQTGRTSNALDHRADLYSLGIMFFITLTERPPFEGSAMDVVHSILSKNVPLVHTIRKDVPPVISLIIDKLTRKVIHIQKKTLCIFIYN